MLEVTIVDLSKMNAKEVREVVRAGKWTSHMSGAALGYVVCNLVVLPNSLAKEFLIFCLRNSIACPVLDVTEPGNPEPTMVAPGADVRTDVSKYRIYKKGKLVDEVTDIKALWRDDFVAFLIGGTFSFEKEMMEAGILLRHIEEKKTCPNYITNIRCVPTKNFYGPLVVSMRPLAKEHVVKAVQISSRYPKAHGAPVHIGYPELIGISDLAKPDFGEAVTVNPEEIPVFWACGVTPQTVAIEAKPEIMITHSPGHPIITDLKLHDIALI